MPKKRNTPPTIEEGNETTGDVRKSVGVGLSVCHLCNTSEGRIQYAYGNFYSLGIPLNHGFMLCEKCRELLATDPLAFTDAWNKAYVLRHQYHPV